MPAQAVPESADPGVDRRQLRVLRTRFRAISAARLERVRTMLPPRHRQFLDLLPLLLHLNHPALPGYVSQGTPCGISGWSPPAATLARATRLARSFAPQRRPAAEARIHAVYLMGSPGTLGHSDRSDLDIWVCYPHDLESHALALLARKTTLLHEWAATLGLEAHLFLMNGEKYRSGDREPLTGENCGTTQHHLLLDEFYRTGILLAGRMPTWWLVPPEHEQDHEAWCTELLRKRHLRATDVVDFGGVAGLSAGEFLSAGIWQLYKAIDSPYKSLLKLLLFEVYASDLPRLNSLSADSKRAVCAGVTDIDELDPYLMIYRRIEHYLRAQAQEARLEIVRRCLYYKVGKKLSMPPRDGKGSWQRRLMERLVDDWGWDSGKLGVLDARRRWNILEVEAERHELVRELRTSYRFLADFTRREGSTNTADVHELAVLGRRLYAAYERRSGKIDTVNPGHAIDVTEREVMIRATHSDTDEAPRWRILRGADTGAAVLREGNCLSELLGWCVANGVIGERTRVALHSHAAGLREGEVRAMLRELRRFMATDPAAGAAEQAFGQGALVTARLVFVNVGRDPLQQARKAGVQRVSSRTDSLGYSALRENLVLNLETVARTSWGELVCARHDGVEGLLRCLGEHLQSGANGSSPQLLVRCFCPSRAQAISARLTELFADLSRHFQHERRDAARYVLEIGDHLHLLGFRKGASRAQSTDGITGLYRLLAEPQPQWSPIAVDRHALARTALRAIVAQAYPWRCCVFLETLAETFVMTISDEHGSLWRAEYALEHEAAVVAAMALFLDAVRSRQGGNAAPSTVTAWFRIVRPAGAEYQTHAMPPPARQAAPCIPVQAVATGKGEHTRFTLHCAGDTFADCDPDADLPERLLARLRPRGTGTAPPVCVTDVDLGHAMRADAPTAHYLHARTRIEQSLTAGLGYTSSRTPDAIRDDARL